MILEDALVHLVEQIRCERHADIAMRKASPIWIWDRAEIQIIELARLETLSMVLKYSSKVIRIFILARFPSSSILRINIARWTRVLLTAAHETHFRVIANIPNEK